MDSFNDLMARLHSGDDGAARQVFERFASRLIGLARRQIDAGLRRKVDPEDVVQSAYRSFFRRNQQDPFKLDGWDSLWGLLSLITLRKCYKQIEFVQADKRNLWKEVELGQNAADSKSAVAFVDRQPTPEDALLLIEAIEVVLRGFDPEDRQVIELCLQGFSPREISQQLGRAERSVRRLRERVRNRLQRMMSEV